MPGRRSKPTPKSAGHGGSRQGAGRKRDVLPPELQEQLGPPPVDDPLKLQGWYRRNLALTLWLFETTGRHVKLLHEVKSTAAVSGKMQPLDVVFTAYQKLKADDQELAEDEDPDEEVRKPDGSSSRAIRRDAP